MARHSKTIGVLFSGGLDSGAMLGFYLKQGYDIWPIYVSCGLPWETQEKRHARRFLKNLRSPKLHPLTTIRLLLENAYDANWSRKGRIPGVHSADAAVFLPARNLLLIIKALLYLSSKRVYSLAMATLNGNPFPDGKPAYFHSLERLLTDSFRKKIRIQTPFRNQDKTAIIKHSKDVPLHFTFSCLNPKVGIHCGRCNKCAERKRAFKKAGVIDKTLYNH